MKLSEGSLHHITEIQAYIQRAQSFLELLDDEQQFYHNWILQNAIIFCFKCIAANLEKIKKLTPEMKPLVYYQLPMRAAAGSETLYYWQCLWRLRNCFIHSFAVNVVRYFSCLSDPLRTGGTEERLFLTICRDTRDLSAYFDLMAQGRETIIDREFAVFERINKLSSQLESLNPKKPKSIGEAEWLQAIVDIVSQIEAYMPRERLSSAVVVQLQAQRPIVYYAILNLL